MENKISVKSLKSLKSFGVIAIQMTDCCSYFLSSKTRLVQNLAKCYVESLAEI